MIEGESGCGGEAGGAGVGCVGAEEEEVEAEHGMGEVRALGWRVGAVVLRGAER